MTTLRASLFVVLLACVASFAGHVAAEDQKQGAAPSEAAMTAARQLVEVSGAAKQFEAVMPMMLAQFEPFFLQQAPGKEAEVREVMARILERFSTRKGEVLEAIAGIYASKFSIEDLKALSAFFASELGVRFIAKQPEIVQESMIAGQKWGEGIGREIEQEIRDELKKRGIKI